ncbi:MAG: 30S ribosomal protein S2 [archaeon]|nr:30S ribosomal protein S2 [archaeon]
MAKTKKTDIDESKNDEEVEAKLEADEEKAELKEEKKEEKTEKKIKKEETDSTQDKKAKLLERAKKLAGEVEEAEKLVNLKKKIKPEEGEGKETLVPMEDYLKSSIHLGTRVITPDMRKYVYRRRADGLAVFNTALLDDMIREGGEFLAKFAPENAIIVCKREAGWKAVQKFSEITGIKAFMKKYPAGILTNTNLDNFMETDLVFICDPWLDKNALEDAIRIKIPVLSICDTNNFIKRITKIVPGNNKSAKSLGLILYLLTKLYIEKRKLNVEMPKISEFVDDWENLQAPK